ncbi:sensor histidine kinase [Paenibacillus chondroitinus]|uniref:Sensor histidine kinase n=1 Tax=Paenibacillus chondroitinus TaxID=59842 RepID=A0ABU6D4P3_9BACL|nr:MULTISPECIES: sensor histidine kinase [Paenibacillus]MCY9660925.1 sensor histidine kinase [Paenibacillus anseongense]MEB4792277.1 sensor histidine kinase [Paenibacillus chondroitinus]
MNTLWSLFPRLFHSISLKQRIWLTFVMLITLGLMATGSIAYLIASKEIQQSTLQSSQDTVNQSSQIVNERLKNIGIAIRALMFNDAFKQLMKDVQNGDTSSYYKSLTALQYVFSQVKFNDSMIDSILIATPTGDFYPTSSVRNTANSFYQSEMYEHFQKLKRGFWSKGHIDPFFTGNQRVISLVVEGVSEYSFLGYEPTNVYVVVNVKEEALRDLYMANLSKTNKRYAFIDAAGESVIFGDQTGEESFNRDPAFMAQFSDEMKGSFFYSHDNKDFLVNYSRLDVKDDWMMVSIQAKDDLLAKLTNIKKATTYAILGFILVSLFIANNLTQLLLKPLFRLQKLMKKVEDNDLTVRFESVYKDEVSQVGFRFNRMLDEIKQLIEDVKNREREKRKAEIKALSAQMDPHFFYNTLNTIYCKSVLGQNDDVNEMILALSQMFQLSLSGGRDVITLGDELDHVRQYLAIQQRSYENLFECRIEVEEALLSCLVPKIMIQPLVENSILHGFKDLTSGGEIGLTIRTDGDWLHITVEDNGHGLIPEKLRQSMATPTTGKHGYALRNIVTRLQLYYGDRQRMEISNNDRGGACIELWLPCYGSEEEFHESTG